jgi:hypothetical protein
MVLHIFYNNVQAALVIRGFVIRGFDYLRTQKQRITRGTASCEPKFALFKAKIKVLLFAVLDFCRNVTPANSEGNLYKYEIEEMVLFTTF